MDTLNNALAIALPSTTTINDALAIPTPTSVNTKEIFDAILVDIFPKINVKGKETKGKKRAASRPIGVVEMKKRKTRKEDL